MEHDEASGRGRVRLPGAQEHAAPGGPAYTWRADQGGMPGYSPRMGHAREIGVRRVRRASTWTAAALIAGVAVTTGYLAHSVPVTGSGSATNTGGYGPAGKSSTGAQHAPGVSGPVVTSGGSGVAGRGGAGGAGGAGGFGGDY